VQSNGETWEQLRRFALRQLRDFGFGKTSMEHLIVDEVKEVIEWMKVHEGEPIGEIKERMSIAVVNSLWTMMSGQRSKQDDPSFLGMTLKK
jgi:methyl farnesoate epoxidase/farnesoate epoxidase